MDETSTQSNWSAHVLCGSWTPQRLESLLSQISPQEAEALLYDWQFWARPAQLPPPGAWTKWLVLAGRGWGKTRVGAEWVRMIAEKDSRARIALVGRTAADVRDVMLYGDSGIMHISPPWARPRHYPSKRLLVWPSGARAHCFSADRPDQLRGPQHTHAWADELAAWRYIEAWDNLSMGLRLGAHPRVVITTTPRPIIRALLNDESAVITRGSTFDNAANLAPTYIAEMRRRYEHTRLGRQELYAEILDDTPGALWTRARLDVERVVEMPCDRVRTVVGVDPAVTSGEDADETGIIVAARGADGHYYILEDLSRRASPLEWARVVLQSAREYGAQIVAEANQGGELIEALLRRVAADIEDQYRVPLKLVRASVGKRTRAEPVAALYEQGRVHHVGYLAELEDQLCTWVPGAPSPDRMDALVWAVTELSDRGGPARTGPSIYD